MDDFSQTSRTSLNHDEDGGTIQTLYDFYLSHKDGFMRFCTIGNSEISEVTYKDYIEVVPKAFGGRGTPPLGPPHVTISGLKLFSHSGPCYERMEGTLYVCIPIR